MAAATLAALLAGMTATPGMAHDADRTVRKTDSTTQGKATEKPRFTRQHITLITGDRVTVEKDPTGRESVSVEPAEGREHIKFLKRQDRGEWTVIPVDALPLLTADRLDKALFNISALVEEKYADRTSLPLIVEYAGGSDAAARRLATAGADKVRTISGTPFATLNEHRDDAAEFWKSIAPARMGAKSFGAGVQRVWLDGRSRVQLDKTVARIGAPQAWEKGYKGDGVKVAVLDTGFDPNHPDLKGLITGSANFTTEPNTDDLMGHGTHVTSIVAGSGAASAGKYKGVAPGAQILSGKVCTFDGQCTLSDIIEGVAWAAEQGAKVINLSLGDEDTPETNALEALVESVTRDHGVLVVAAAGNSGNTVLSPASVEGALAVGAMYPNDELASFSSIGPRAGDSGLKPDLAAPGVDVVAARSGGTTADDGYTGMSGTSMATPHVAGAAAILFQQHPDWTPEQVKRQLMQTTAGAFERGAYYQGAGRVDVARAVVQQVTAEPTGLSFGQIRWNDGGRPPVTKTLTYRNAGSEPVTLGLSHNASHKAGKQPAPEGLFRLSADKVTVPAHGSADVTLTATPETATVYAAYSGVVIASTADKSVSVRTPFGMDVEQPSYDLRLSVKDRSGKAPDHAYLMVDSNDYKSYEVELHGRSSTVLRLPKGKTYSVGGFLFDETYTEGTVVGVPEIAMTTDRDAAIDARKAKPVTISAPSRSARMLSNEFGTIGLSDSLFSVNMPGAIGGDRIEGLYAAPTVKVKNSTFAYLVSSIWAEPAADGANPSSVYYLTRPVFGAIPADPAYNPRTSDLAEVNSTFAATAPGAPAFRFIYQHVGNVRFGGHMMKGVPVPSRRVDYFSGGEGLRWQTGFDQLDFMDPNSPHGQMYLSALHGYKTGAKVEERWNQGVQAMGFAPEGLNTFREGNDILYAIQDAANGNLDLVAGTSAAGRENVQLYRNGELVTESRGYASVPDDPTPADYRLNIQVQRDRAPLSRVSTDLRAEWRFRSQTTTERKALPLYAVRMAPELDEWNRAKDGRKFDIPVLIQQPVGAAASPIRTFTTEVSFDEGKTWRAAKVKGTGMKRTVTVDHPHRSSGGSVSLRTYVKDAAGNSLKQTVIKAYLLK